jgi:hypothetical protein
MAHKYCDWTNGNDLTGDGTASLPYKTIEKAATTLGGGDEVRVAKGPSHSALSGTLTFSDGSANVSTSVDLRGSLSIHDMIGKNVDDMCWWRITNITATIITLATVYSGTNGTVSAYKMGGHNLGTAVANDTVFDILTRSGTSLSSRFLISGGWNLTNEQQDNETFFRQTGSNLYGIGLSINCNYIQIEKLHYSRCYYGICLPYGAESIGNRFGNLGFYSPEASGFFSYIPQILMSFFGTIKISQCNGNYSFQIDSYSNRSAHIQSDAEIISLSCKGGPFLCGGDSYWKKIVTKRTGNIASLNIGQGNNINIGEFEVSNSDIGLDCGYSTSGLVVGKLTATLTQNVIGTPAAGTILVHHYLPTSTTNDINYQSGEDRCGNPTVKIQRWGNSNYSGRIYFKGLGTILQETTEGRSLRCLKFTPSLAIAGIAWPIGNVKCTNPNLDLILLIYLKKNAQFNGIVELAGFVMGQNTTGWIAKSVTTSYAQYSVTIPYTSLLLTEFVELQVRVNGTAGNVFVDDFSANQ